MAQGKPRLQLTGLVLVVGMLLPSILTAELAVIVNPDSGVSQLTPAQIRALYLLKLEHLPSGVAAEPIDQRDAKTKQQFLDQVLQLDLVTFKRRRASEIFSGKARSPRTLDSDHQVRAYVAAHRGAVGYIRAEHINPSVTVVYTTDSQDD